ncbi:MAG: TerC family protein [Pseudomonadota bacterium]
MSEIPALLVSPEAWIALATLILMEVVLGIDNLLFISILTNKLPEERRPAARRLGIGLAMVLRLVLLAGVAWIVQLSEPVFELLGQAFSWKDLIMLAGGLFLVWKATHEIHTQVDPDPEGDFMRGRAERVGFAAVVGQILILDVVFSVDSIITAVGMTPHVPIMVTAVVIAVITMLVAAGPLSRFVEANPTVVMLALSFLLMIGMTLLAEGMGFHLPKGYVYAAMGFSVLVEGLNLAARRARSRRRAARAAQAGDGA